MFKIRFICFLLLIVLTTLLINCAGMSIKPNIYNEDEIHKINKWYISFTYEITSIEETAKSEGANETTIKRGGQYLQNLQLLDDIYFHLKDEYNLQIYKNEIPECGFIRINPVMSVNSTPNYLLAFC